MLILIWRALCTMHDAYERRAGRVLLRFFALFCSCYVLGVLFLHYSASSVGGRAVSDRKPGILCMQASRPAFLVQAQAEGWNSTSNQLKKGSEGLLTWPTHLQLVIPNICGAGLHAVWCRLHSSSHISFTVLNSTNLLPLVHLWPPNMTNHPTYYHIIIIPIILHITTWLCIYRPEGLLMMKPHDAGSCLIIVTCISLPLYKYNYSLGLRLSRLHMRDFHVHVYMTFACVGRGWEWGYSYTYTYHAQLFETPSHCI